MTEQIGYERNASRTAVEPQIRSRALDGDRHADGALSDEAHYGELRGIAWGLRCRRRIRRGASCDGCRGGSSAERVFFRSVQQEKPSCGGSGALCRFRVRLRDRHNYAHARRMVRRAGFRLRVQVDADHIDGFACGSEGVFGKRRGVVEHRLHRCMRARPGHRLLFGRLVWVPGRVPPVSLFACRGVRSRGYVQGSGRLVASCPPASGRRRSLEDELGGAFQAGSAIAREWLPSSFPRSLLPR